MKEKLSKYDIAVKTMHEVLDTFPMSHNNKPYLRAKTGQKIFFNVFLRKYGLDGSRSKYKKLDVMRRIRLIEFFPYFLNTYGELSSFVHLKKQVIQSHFFRMVLVRTGKKWKERFELLSFYYYK